jgi:hypothetical protein
MVYHQRIVHKDIIKWILLNTLQLDSWIILE